MTVESVEIDRAEPVCKHGPFRVPDIESPFSFIRAFAGGRPVILRPIPVPGPELQNEVVGECRDVEASADFLIMHGVGQVVSARIIDHVIPRHGVAVPDPVHGHHVPILIAVIPFLAERILDMFARIEIAFVFTIDKQVGHRSAAIHASHILVQTPDELVFDKWIHAIVVASPKHDGFEAFDFKGKERILQPARAVRSAKVKSK